MTVDVRQEIIDVCPSPQRKHSVEILLGEQSVYCFRVTNQPECTTFRLGH